jgi:mannose-6-phosphate isomerase class I
MRKPNYDRFPEVAVTGFGDAVWSGYADLCAGIQSEVSTHKSSRVVVAVECYPGVMDRECLSALQHELNPALTVNASSANWDADVIRDMLKHDLTDDRVRGYLNNSWKMADFFDAEKVAGSKAEIAAISGGLVLVYGTGATLFCEPDVLVYADMARWEIQLRYRREEISNWCDDNFGEDFLRMYKRGFFVDWRVADRHKLTVFERIDFLLDTNEIGSPKMISGDAFRAGLKQTANQPFRIVPYFDAGPWGGQWMKEVCQLDPDMPNYAWCFDGVPEENSLLLNYGGTRIEVPSIDVVLFHPLELLGNMVHARFGREFPIRFDFLDTIQGGKLSLQVHPTTEYIQQHFGIPYTQDESYYMLAAEEDAVVYLGVKNGVDPDEMVAALERAQAGEEHFDAEQFVNVIPAKQHDHFLIPGGMVHCSGANGMVLEISATPYIFTFKLWDWGRLGMDGKPRPIHIDHGANVINYNFDTDMVMREAVNCLEAMGDGDGWREERTGLHEREFIESRRHWFTKSVPHDTNGVFHILNLVQGDEALVESPIGAFEPFVVHFAETFIIPAAVGEYTIRPVNDGEECATMKAYVRGGAEAEWNYV